MALSVLQLLLLLLLLPVLLQLLLLWLLLTRDFLLLLLFTKLLWHEITAAPAAVPVLVIHILMGRAADVAAAGADSVLLVLTQSCWCQSWWPAAAVSSILQARLICPEARYH